MMDSDAKAPEVSPGGVLSELARPVPTPVRSFVNDAGAQSCQLGPDEETIPADLTNEGEDNKSVSCPTYGSTGFHC